MSAKKTSGTNQRAEIESLQAKNAALELEIGDLEKQAEMFRKEFIRMEDRYNEERKQRVEAQRVKVDLEEEVLNLSIRLQVAEEMRAVEKRKRHGSIPKFVIVAAIALVVLMASFMLQKLCAIGPSVGYGIQCGMAMVIAWCYAIIWDRSRK